MKVAARLLLAVAIAHPADPAGAASFPTYYDDAIQRASARWLPWDWRWLKAQLIAESGLNPKAVSRTGARGLAQLMPATHGEIASALNAGLASPHDVEYSIEAAAYYMARMRRTWKGEREEADRRELAQASYNAGAGNIIKAQRRCIDATGGSCRSWQDIKAHLVEVTGEANSAETLGYVARIARIRARLGA